MSSRSPAAILCRAQSALRALSTGNSLQKRRTLSRSLSTTATPLKISPVKDQFDYEVDHLVIGGGVVGLAIAEKLARSSQGSVLLVEKNTAVGQETSSRNSEVIHAGLYYPETSLKTKLCIRGNELLYDLCQKHDIAHQKTTKWVVAQTEADLEYLENLSKKAHRLLLPTKFQKTGPPTYMISQEQMKTQEPNVKGRAALVSPRTGIIDVHELMQFLETQIQDLGGDVVLHCRVSDLERLASDALGSNGQHDSFRVRMETPAGPVTVKATTVINSAGLYSDRILNMLYTHSEPSSSFDIPPYQLHFCKGHYYGYSGPSLVSRLIYPVPDKNLAGLGTHLTLDLAGRMRFGPDILYVDNNEDYSVEGVDSHESLEKVAKVIQTYLPAVKASSLYADYSGIRPKLAGPGEPFRDFEIQHWNGYVNLAGIESPGLTSSLAIAEYVAGLLYGGKGHDR